MTSGAKNTAIERASGSTAMRAPGRLRSVLLGLLLAGCALPALALELGELMGLLAVRSSGEATFTEQRFVQGLDEPLRASGTLSFAAPDRMTRRVLSPRPETMVVEGNTLTLTRGGRSRTFALDATPEMTAAVEAVRGTLTGNAGALQRYFRTTLAGSLEQWTLELRPLDAQLAREVHSVRIAGRRGDLRSIETLLTGGDRSLMSIEPLRAGAAAASTP